MRSASRCRRPYSPGPTMLSNSDAFCCAACVGFWHKAADRRDAAIRSLTEVKRTLRTRQKHIDLTRTDPKQTQTAIPTERRFRRRRHSSEGGWEPPEGTKIAKTDSRTQS